MAILKTDGSTELSLEDDFANLMRVERKGILSRRNNMGRDMKH